LPENASDSTSEKRQEDTVSAPTTRPPHRPATPPDTEQAVSAVQSTSPKTVAPRTLAPEQLTGAQAVIRSLEELDVDTIFGIPGGAVLPVYDPLFDSQKLRHVLVRH
jgi:acetolactate synthase-1/2/3 large subunit